MPCCLLVIAAFVPRIALAIMWIIGYSGPAFETILWPLLGFFFMPYTTCAYAFGMIERGSIDGWALLLLIIGVVLDFGSHGSGGYRYRKTKVVRLAGD